INRQQLALWQSTVAEVTGGKLAEALGSAPRRIEILEHPAVKATDDFARLRRDHAEPPGGPELAADSADPDARNVYLSSLTFAIAQARAEGRTDDEEQLMLQYVPFSDKDPHFLECAAVYAAYSPKY